MSLANLKYIHPELEVDFSNGVLSLKINRPERKNALYSSLYLALEAVLIQADQISDVQVVILRGIDKDFSAGNDLQDFDKIVKLGLEAPAFKLLRAAHQFKKPLIMAVKGVAIGIGTTILLHADLVYCDPTSRFQLPFTSLGLSPEGASSLLLPRQIGYLRASELLMLATPFDAVFAKDIGLVNDVVITDVYDYAFQKAKKLAALPSASLQITKAMLKQSENRSVLDCIDKEGEIFLQRLQSPELKEALTAFSQKRQPNFNQFN
ncbi:MAG: enoyl-CoA hydratase [Acinetobacter haemolyticus]